MWSGLQGSGLQKSLEQVGPEHAALMYCLF